MIFAWFLKTIIKFLKIRQMSDYSHVANAHPSYIEAMYKITNKVRNR